MIRPRIAIPEPSALNQEYSRNNWPRYASAVESAGADPIRVSLAATPAEIARTLAVCQGILLPGSGADLNPAKYGEAPNGSNPPDQHREAADELLLQDAFNLRKPILAICYGFQSMNVWLNGSLIQDLPAQRPSTITHHRVRGELPPPHAASLKESSRLRGFSDSSEILVNSSHHQAVDRLGDGLQLAAASTGDGIVEAAEFPGQVFVLGIQWHPERDFQQNAFSRRIFEAFTEAARAWQPIPNRVSGS